MSITINRVINIVINKFQRGNDHGDESFITPHDLFEITKLFISFEITYFEFNEIKSKHLWRKLHKFTNDSFRVVH